MIYLYIKLDSHQCGAPGLWETLYKEHMSSWPECVTSKASDIIKILLLVFKKDFIVYDSVYVVNVYMLGVWLSMAQWLKSSC